ncbi:MAG: hypothetical protein AABX14_02535 [Candidatus Aenigmatarchaeota archaeon]
MPSEAVEALQRKLKTYLDAGWHIDPSDRGFRYMIIHPDGECYIDRDLVLNQCPYCDEDEPGWCQERCDHSETLLAKEEDAKEMYKIIERLERWGVRVV